MTGPATRSWRRQGSPECRALRVSRGDMPVDAEEWVRPELLLRGNAIICPDPARTTALAEAQASGIPAGDS